MRPFSRRVRLMGVPETIEPAKRAKPRDDGRKNNGGPRDNSGRKPKAATRVGMSIGDEFLSMAEQLRRHFAPLDPKDAPPTRTAIFERAVNELFEREIGGTNETAS